ncbi:endoglucanase [Pseudoalteromonas sp. NBT06-2]|nr:endoglucanase [Pseudoalteromonas sp. NBT06-2]
MTACGVNSDSPDLDSTSTTIPSVDPQPKLVGLSALHTEGVKWVNAENKTVTLKGTNLGNWLLHEFWMMNQSSNTVATDQCTLEATFDERFGFEERERLLDMFRDNWIAERDWDILESYGLNTIRLPFVWNVIENEKNPMTLRADAWQYIDYAIEQAQARGMYVILDLHGAVGAQGWADHSGCAGQNQYWSTPEYQERTIWLWQQIAERYKDNGTVAAYGLLNEPWGTEADNLANVMIDLYKAVRETDAKKIIVLPGHHSGIDEYGHPDSFDGTNVAFEMHFYPGIFGWAEPNYETHRDWLTCGEDGAGGVCAWDAKMQDLASPLLIGEFQPWQSLGYEFGGENARATYDKFAELNWAATNWSYKVLTGDGGQGAGTWGMVTNKKNSLGLVTKASTWNCAGWDSSFSNACAAASDAISPTVAGKQTYYLVIKSGTCCGGKLDITLDKISLLDDLGNEVILNGNFGSQNSWTTWVASGAPTIDYNVTDADSFPTGSEGTVLRMSGLTDTNITEFNGGIYQAITLEGGKNYTLSGVFKDNTSVNAWAEIYIVTDEPVEGKDVVSEQALPSVDFANAPIAEIESIFQLYGTVEYDIHQPLLTAMTATQASTLYTLPAKPTGLSIMLDDVGAHLSWNANQEEDVTGYNIYRSTNNNSNYQLIAENAAAETFSDTTITDSNIYYFKITAIDAQDISFDSEEVVSGVLVNTLPGVIQAENWTDMAGFEVEVTSDIGGGNNTGFADTDDWLEYNVNINEAGSYQVEYRLASESGSDGFNLTLDGELIDTVTVNSTGGWQSWSTQTSTLNLPAGEHTLRIESLGGGWNFNWMQFSVLP